MYLNKRFEVQFHLHKKLIGDLTIKRNQIESIPLKKKGKLH